MLVDQGMLIGPTLAHSPTRLTRHLNMVASLIMEAEDSFAAYCVHMHRQLKVLASSP